MTEPGGAEPDGPTEGQPRFRRDDLEFARALNFFDATFAIATTLLVTTLATGPEQWSSWSNFRSATTGPLFAYALSFIVVCTFWWANHRFVSELAELDSRTIRASLLMMAFVVLLPFSTQGLGAYSAGGEEVPTVIYALNVAAVSLSMFLVFRIALADQLFRRRPTSEEILRRTVNTLDVPLVFLVSVPIAIFWSADAARWSWLAMVVLAPLEGWWFAARRRQQAKPSQ